MLIFELFGKKNCSAKNTNSEGAGLGLTISNLIVKGLSGGGCEGISVCSNSEVEHGSIFSFYLACT